MTLRNVIFLLFILGLTAVVGYLVSWYLSAGICIGVLISWYVYARRFSVVDEIESEVGWYANHGWKYQPEGEDHLQITEVLYPLIVIIALIAVVMMVFFGLLDGA